MDRVPQPLVPLAGCWTAGQIVDRFRQDLLGGMLDRARRILDVAQRALGGYAIAQGVRPRSGVVVAGGAAVEPSALAETAPAQVHVGVDQSGKDRASVQVVHAGAGRDDRRIADRGDRVAGDEDGGAGHGGRPGSVDQKCVGECPRHVVICHTSIIATGG